MKVGEREYKLKNQTATLMVRPRGWHLDEAHVLVHGKPGMPPFVKISNRLAKKLTTFSGVPCAVTVSGSLFDFGLYIYHNGHALLSRGSGPYFYLPKMESHLEARLWADAFRYAEQRLDIPHGSIKATVLIGTSGPPSPSRRKLASHNRW